MSELDPQTLRRDLLLEAGVGRVLDRLVRQANTTAALLKGKDRMEENQLRNLLNVAVSSRSVEVVINFIRYQIARSRDTWGTGDKDFGHTVIHDLRTIVVKLANEVTDGARAAMPALADDQRLQNDAFTQLMLLYLGYLNRAFVYGKKTNDFDRLLKEAKA